MTLEYSITDKKQYATIFKAIGLFGGTKLFQILIGVIKNKFVAVLLGPFGMGISGLLVTNAQLVKSFTDLGLHTSAVRDVAQSYKSKDMLQIGRTIAILRHLVWFTGILGTLVVFFFAKEFSINSFGTDEFTNAFRIISVTLLFDQLCVGQTVLMQGTFHYRYMASAALVGSIAGLVISVPLYFVWRVHAIAPVLVITSAVSLLLSWHYSRKIEVKKVNVTFRDIFSGGKVMMFLGFAFAMAGILRYGKALITQVFISNMGNIADVGLYSAAIAIATQYINVVLNAMGADYSPRLAAIANQNDIFTETINRQNQLMLTIIVPIILAFIVFIKPFTILLYSTKFLPIMAMIEWMMLGMFFRATSWCLSFAFVAKGEAKLFFWNEFASTCYSLVFFIIGYIVAKFEGMGIAYFMSYVVYTIQVWLLCSKKYHFRYTSDNFRLIVSQMSFVLSAFVILKFLGYSYWRYLIGISILFIALWYTYGKLNEMVAIKETVKNIERKIKNSIKQWKKSLLYQ